MNSLSDDDSARPISDDERDRLLKPLSGVPLALCVSGGADSMALMHLVAEWAAAGNHAGARSFSRPYRPVIRRDPRPVLLPTVRWLKGNGSGERLEQAGGPPPIVVLSVDHGLRSEAAAETRFVAEEAAKLGLPHQALRADEPPPDTGIQEWARNLRHRLILELLDAEAWQLLDLGVEARCGIGRVLVMAHHLDDQAETVLMRLARGSGLAGLGGMRPEQVLSLPANHKRDYAISRTLRRPFLSVPKARLVSSLDACAIGWKSDPSNDDASYERVRVRQALDEMESLGLKREMIALSARRLRDADTALKRLANQWESGKVDWGGGLHGSVRLRRLCREGERYLGVGLFERVLRAFGGAARPASLAQVEGLFAKCMAGDCRAVLETGGLTMGGCRIEFLVQKDEPVMRVYREGGGVNLGEIELAPGQEVSWDGGRFKVASANSNGNPVTVAAIGAHGWAKLKMDIVGLKSRKPSLPAAAMATLPAIWSGDTIVAVPFFDNYFRSNQVMEKAILTGIGQDIGSPQFTAGFSNF
ncbi:MAG: tRNA lysidine(34) synthetase TilS [Alphaproteobacteria bacterium]|nr:tRNA lysidine(34) synthetase TilS [Alphaproteobacteria bacterium]